MYAAYILINLNIAVDFRDTLTSIRAIPSVKQAHLVVGPVDCIAYIEAADSHGGMETLQAIRATPGVEHTDSRPVADI